MQRLPLHCFLFSSPPFSKSSINRFDHLLYAFSLPCTELSPFLPYCQIGRSGALEESAADIQIRQVPCLLWRTLRSHIDLQVLAVHKSMGNGERQKGAQEDGRNGPHTSQDMTLWTALVG